LLGDQAIEAIPASEQHFMRGELLGEHQSRERLRQLDRAQP
jgi:hypothetical protein